MSIARGLSEAAILLLLGGRCQGKAVAIGTAEHTASARLTTAMPEQDPDANKVNFCRRRSRHRAKVRCSD